MQTVLIVIHLVIVLALVGLVLVQKSEGGGLGMGGGGGFMSSRGTTNALSRATAILGTLFFATSLLLTILASSDKAPRSILGGSSVPSSGQPAVPGPAGSGSGVLDRLQAPPPAPGAPAAPQAPSGPQVPQSN